MALFFGASIDSVSGLCGVIPGGGGGGSGGGGGTCAAAASTLNIRAHSLHDTVRPGLMPPATAFTCPQCMQAIVSLTCGSGTVAPAALAAAGLPALGLWALVGLLGLRTFGTPSLSAHRRGG